MERRAFLRAALAGAGFIAASRTVLGAKQCGAPVSTMTPMGPQPIEIVHGRNLFHHTQAGIPAAERVVLGGVHQHGV